MDDDVQLPLHLLNRHIMSGHNTVSDYEVTTDLSVVKAHLPFVINKESEGF